MKEMKYVVDIDIKNKLTVGVGFDDEHIQDLAQALSQVPRVIEFLQEFLQTGETQVWEDLLNAGWGWIPPHNWDDLDEWDYGLCWYFLGDYVGVTITAEA